MSTKIISSSIGAPEEKPTQKELNAEWLKFAEIIERHGKENGVSEWIS